MGAVTHALRTTERSVQNGQLRREKIVQDLKPDSVPDVTVSNKKSLILFQLSCEVAKTNRHSPKSVPGAHRFSGACNPPLHSPELPAPSQILPKKTPK